MRGLVVDCFQHDAVTRGTVLRMADVPQTWLRLRSWEKGYRGEKEVQFVIRLNSTTQYTLNRVLSKSGGADALIFLQ